MTAPAAPPAAFPLPDDLAAALDAGQPVLFRHPRSGLSFALSPDPVPAETTDGVSDEPAPGELTDEDYAAAQLHADGGEKLTELDALRRAVASNEADLAAGIKPLTMAEADARMEAEFPALKAHRDRRRRERAQREDES